MNKLFKKIDTSGFTDTDYEIMNFIIDHFTIVSMMSLRDFATKLYTSEATIVRFCQKAGFSGFNELKYTLKTEQLKTSEPTNFRNQIDTKVTDLKNFLNEISSNDMQQIVELLVNGQPLYLHGRSLSSIPARYLHTVLNSLDRRCILIEDLHLLKSISQTIKAGSTLLIISANAPYSIYEPVFKAAQQNHATSVLLTTNKQSSLIELSDITLFSDDASISYNDTDVNSRIHLLTLIQLIIDSVSTQLIG